MKAIDFTALKEIIKGNSNKRAFLTFHSMGDTDAISSAFALQQCFQIATVATPDFITGNSIRIMRKLGFDPDLLATNFDDDAEIVVLLDVNNFEDCGAFKEKLENFKGTIVVIDHHSPKQIDRENVVVFNDESYNSAASIVYELLNSLDIKINKNLANLLLTGIISDSAELRNAFPQTFIQIGELLETINIDYQSVLLEMQHVASIPSRSEFIKDLFGSQVLVSDGLLIVYGGSRMHANIVADDAIRIGADLALFYTVNEKEISFSARLRPPLDKTRQINLGKIMKSLAPIINGQGGGHPAAAGAYGPQKEHVQKFLDAFMMEIETRTKN